jgi:Cu/Ag efflux protein CusF
MTRVFRVNAPAMPRWVKERDKIGFLADRVNGAITVTQLEVAR